MDGGVIAMALVVTTIVGVTGYLMGTLIRSIQAESRGRMKLWKNFGLSLVFCSLFLITWVAHGVAQWQHYTDEQRDHNEPVEVSDFVSEFSSSTLENWQSEFLQLFSFTILAAVFIHKGSAESKDSDDRMQAALKRIEEKLATEPTSQGDGASKDLHVIPDGTQGWQLRSGDSSEPEGYYDVQEEAIDAGRDVARSKGVRLLIHGTDGKVRDSESFTR